MFIENLYAQGAPAGAAAGSGSALGFIVPMVLMIAVFYFLIIRPQNKKEKEKAKMVNSLQKGDKVITVGGIFGEVTGVRAEEGIVVLKIAEGCKIDVTKSSIQQKIEKTEKTEKK